VTVIFFEMTIKGVRMKSFAAASREVSRKIGARISLDGLTRALGRAEEDGARVNKARDRHSAHLAAYQQDQLV